METSGEFTAPSPEERIRQAALEHVLDAEVGIWGSGSENQTNRALTFWLEADQSQEEDALSIVHIISTSHLRITITDFREELAATEPTDTYEVTGLTWITFPDHFDSKIEEKDQLTLSALERIATLLEDEELKELNVDSFEFNEKLYALLAAKWASQHLVVEGIVSQHGASQRPDSLARHLKVREVASKLKGILRF